MAWIIPKTSFYGTISPVYRHIRTAPYFGKRKSDSLIEGLPSSDKHRAVCNPLCIKRYIRSSHGVASQISVCYTCSIGRCIPTCKDEARAGEAIGCDVGRS